MGRDNKFTTKDITQYFQKVVKELGSLCWSENAKTKFSEIFNKWETQNPKILVFLNYFEKNWIPRFDHLLDYKNIDQSLRSNSILENFNLKVQQKAKKNPSLGSILEVLIYLENEYSSEVIVYIKKGLKKVGAYLGFFIAYTK